MARYLKQLPESGAGKYERGPYPEHLKIVKTLRRRPGRWVMVREFRYPSGASAFARKIREGTFKAFRDGTYEAKSVGAEAYARYVED